jgi:leader peptidase (prepilin peptidase)/N-methyltransferase
MLPAPLAEFAAAFPWFFPAAAFLFGACIGSFLNVCILRIPAGRSVVSPRSSCACGTPIAWYDNVPILSWFLLGGKARCCGRPYSIRYPFVEFLTAALFMACWLVFPPAKALCGWVLVSALIAATFIDLDHMIIPDVFTIGLAVAGLLLSLIFPSLHLEPEVRSGLFMSDSLRSVTIALQGMLFGSGMILWITLVAEAVLKKEAMGGADIKLVGAIGAFTGWTGAVTAMFGGAFVSLAWISLAWLFGRMKGGNSAAVLKTETPDGEPAPIGFGVQLPFGPMIAIAGGLHFLWLHRWVDAYFENIAMLITASW